MREQLRLVIFILIACLLSAVSYAADSEVLNMVSVRKIEGNKLICINSYEIRINNREGDEAAEISIFYDKKDNVNIESACIEDVLGKVVRKLKKNEITQRQAYSYDMLYMDTYVKEFQLRHNTYPYVIKYSYKIVLSDFLAIASWYPFLEVNQPVKSAQLTVDIPLNYQIKKKEEFIDSPQVDTLGNTVRYTWNTSYAGEGLQRYVSFSSLPIPCVTVLPLQFKYGVNGSWKSWESFGTWITELNSKGRNLPLSEKEKIDKLLSGISDPKEKVSILYSYLQNNTRYINVKIDVGGLKAYPAEYVSVNKYGDCKALSNYMVSMLEYAGIKSYYTLIQAGDKIEETDKNFPMQAFNHVIVTVPLNKDTIFLECTDKNIPCGYLGAFTQGRDAFIVDGENSRFIRTPEQQPSDVLCTSVINVPVTSGYATVEMKMYKRGREYDYFTSLSTQLRKDDVEKYIRNMYSGSFEINNYSIEKEDNNRPEITFRLNLKMSNTVKLYGNEIILPVFPQKLPDIESPELRTQPLQLYYPIAYQDTVIYHFDDDRKIKATPKNISIHSRFGNYNLNFDFSENRLTVTKNILIFKGLYRTPEDYKDFYAFLSSIKTNESKNIHIKSE